MWLGFVEGHEVAKPCSGAVPALTPHFTLAAGPPVTPRLCWLSTFPPVSGSQAGRGGQRGVLGGRHRGVTGFGMGLLAPIGFGMGLLAPCTLSPLQTAVCPWHGAAPWLTVSRLLFLISFAFSSVPNELGRGEFGLVSEELVLGHARAVQGWPFPGPALRHRTGWEGAELGVSGQEAPQEGMSCRQTKREKIGGHWHTPQGTHVQTRQ